MTKHEKAILKEAVAIMTRELESGNEVRLPRFGKIYTKPYAGSKNHPLDEYGAVKDIIMTKVYFRPWAELKAKVCKHLPMCKFSLTEEQTWKTPCYHHEGAGHSGPHINWEGKPFYEKDR